MRGAVKMRGIIRCGFLLWVGEFRNSRVSLIATLTHVGRLTDVPT